MKVGDLVRSAVGQWMGIVVRTSNGYIKVLSWKAIHLGADSAGWYSPQNFEVINEDR